MRKNKGFTLVEILIVVVILGILAAIVIPQFSDASTQSKVSSLQSSLQTLRSQISLYKIQHNDAPPVVATFDTQMTGFTDVDGNVNATKTAVFCFGPYLQSVPNNPFTNGSTVGSATTFDWNYTVTGTEATIYAGADTTTDSAVHQAY
ncbi:MAG: type II secretion system protein [Phycisphaerae bacterium]|nr:type II secretion system protein [Phycisphaerae bacterium]